MSQKKIAFILSFSVHLNVMTGLFLSYVFVFYFFSASVEFCSLRVYTRAGLWHFVITCHGQLDTWASLSLYMWIPTNSLKFSQLLKLCWKFTPCPLCPTCQFSNQHQKYLRFRDIFFCDFWEAMICSIPTNPLRF